MKKQGTVIRWDRERAFGFIRGEATGADVFFHLRDFRAVDGQSPRQGLEVSFQEIHVGGKGPRGMAVRPFDLRMAATPASTASSPFDRVQSPPRSGAVRRQSEGASVSHASLAVPLMLAYGAVIAWAVSTHRLSWWVLIASSLVNLATFLVYSHDKYAAGHGGWRIREDTLHFWSLAGGWPTAWITQQVLRHKSRKASFRQTFWLTVVLHCMALAGWIGWLGPYLVAIK